MDEILLFNQKTSKDDAAVKEIFADVTKNYEPSFYCPKKGSTNNHKGPNALNSYIC